MLLKSGRSSPPSSTTGSRQAYRSGSTPPCATVSRFQPSRAIRQSELENSTPYNTRLHKGLPPTPINNPGVASIEAAAKPADVDYLYFVRKADCKTHFFTASEQEFLAALDGPRC